MSIRLGDEAPDFTAETTEGTIDFHQWKDGKWAVLFSHPADFTPVCTTELGRTASLKSEFDQRGVRVMGVSVDPVESHNSWAQDITDVGGTDLNFPLIADQDRQVSELYDGDPPHRPGGAIAQAVNTSELLRALHLFEEPPQ